ncbi:WGR domain-containing protein [Escherichia coli]|uniref:WGR domain-containing protein n=1 Tax=Escherichia coli TaxID=562 RepID=UPI002351A6A7|nr:WGR domain-containing protein [Escherichia coli]
MKKRFIYHDEKSNKFWWIDYEGDSLAVNYGKVGSIGKFQTKEGNDSNLLIVFYVQIMPDDFVMQLHRF